MAFAILICAPDICRISFILVPWRPIMHPINCGEKAKVFESEQGFTSGNDNHFFFITLTFLKRWHLSAIIISIYLQIDSNPFY